MYELLTRITPRNLFQAACILVGVFVATQIALLIAAVISPDRVHLLMQAVAGVGIAAGITAVPMMLVSLVWRAIRRRSE